jgi:DNA primase
LLIPEHKIEEILDRADIVAVISRHVELRKSGRSFKGKCPFHQEKSASFYVTPDIRRFKCFGCQAGGDVIAFVQRYLGKTFVDAVRDLAREVGIDLEAAVDPSMRERQQLKEATDLAQAHFRAQLASEAGRKAREYLASRGVSEKNAQEFGLGYAPLMWSLLADKLREAGLLEFGVRAGLVAPRSRGDGYYDLFRGRLIVPIRAPEGRTIAFGGRLLEGEDGPKYLNSKESKLYNKSEVLFGMDLAREELRRRKSAVLVEGYFDCIALHEAGVKNALALCSTALTLGHLGVLGRAEAKELVLMLDGDEAGKKAVERLAGPILAAGMAAKVALLPDGEDPDTFVRKEGADGAMRLVEQAKPLSAHLFDAALPEGPAASFEAKMSALERLRPVASPLPVGLVRSAFFGAMSRHFGLPAQELEASLRGKSAPPKPQPKPQAAAPWQGSPQREAQARPPRPLARPAAERPPDLLEARYAALVLRLPRLVGKDEHRVQDELSHSGLRALVAHALTLGAQDALYEAAEGTRMALDAARRELPEDESALEPLFVDLCRKLKLRRVEEQLSYIAKVTGRLDGASELTEDARRLIEQRVELLALKRRLLERVDGPGRK